MASEAIIKRLLNLEAWAEGLKNEATRLRVLIQADVSTSTKNQRALDDKHIAGLLKSRRKNMLRPMK